MSLWSAVDVFVDQLSVPPVVAQTVGRLCGSTVSATIGGTDSWVTKTSTTQTVGILCGPSVCATFGGTDSWITKTSLTQTVAILCGPSACATFSNSVLQCV